jgi:hypothetical protein
MHPSRDELGAFAHFGDSMDGAARAALEAHLAGCADCRARLDESRAEGDILRSALSRADGPSIRLLRTGNWKLRTGVAAAAALLIGLLLLARSKPPLPPPAPALAAAVTPVRDAAFTILDPRRLRLERGELYVDGALTIETAAGTFVTAGSQSFVGVDMRQSKAVVMVLVLSGLVQLSNPLGAESGSRGESLWAAQDEAPKKHVEDLAARFAKHYAPVEVKGKPSIPSYELPLDLSKVANLAAVSKALGLAKDEPLLVKNGFVVLPAGRENSMVTPYGDLRDANVPIFVTADTLLHLYHVQFDESLKDIEEREFHGDITAIATMLAARLSAEHAAAKATMKDALWKALACASIGLKALNPDAAIDAAVKEEVDRILVLMGRHEGRWPEPSSAEAQWPLFRYSEDFSQYVPRGHYTRSEILKRYFVGMMWFGRMTLLLKGGEPHGISDEPFLVSFEEAKLQSLAAAWITKLLATEKLADGRSAREVWDRVYGVTAFYVGLADDLGLPEYADALARVAGAALDVSKIADDAPFVRFQEELAKHPAPAIYGGTGGLATNEGPKAGKLTEALAKTTGFRLMGQRFVPDSYIMGRLVFPTVGRPSNGRTDMFTCTMGANGPIRGFPRGLDVMALLGSERARELLAELGDDGYGTQEKGKDLKYQVVFDALKKEFDGFTAKDWNRNLYWSWLWSLKPLLEKYGDGYQTFMTTAAWRDKSLSTALGSWAQLRHDTILYVKQSETLADGGMAPPRPKKVGGYVEPVPQFYARLLALTRMTKKGLGEMKVLTEPALERLARLDEILARLLEISEKEIADRELTDGDLDFIKHFADALENVRVRYPDLEKELEKARAAKDRKRIRELVQQIAGEKSMMTTLIADVHTDSNSRQVLEEGTGYVRMLVACYRQADGSLVLGAGPVFSYHEFKHPMEDRLTDEKWIEMLKAGKHGNPDWIKSHVK